MEESKTYCTVDAKNRHYWQYLGLYGLYKIYQCSQCHKWMRENLRYINEID